ncbi:MAG: peptidase, partial [Candidatus Aegiribacteria sp.]|nr:peptidase [Candidatus Aegiribacteria sp.]MBD3294816.1 peptidase [Candidatus Fermentibacteria bacterium]
RDFGEILVYPGGFKTDGSYSTDISGADKAAAGMVHSTGNVILSLPHLLRGFQHDNDGYNVGYHEFAHVLDGYRPDGIPDELSLGAYRPWVEVMHREFEKVHKGRSMLRTYAGTNPAEFFACAVEAFFEKPKKMRKKAPELYAQLSEFFNQKP